MLAPGTRIGKRYLIEGLLGQGGMSNLYMARDVPNGNAVRVIKEMTARYPDPNEQAQAEALFMREAELLATLNHPNIPKVFDKFKFQGLFYLSMELVQGEDLGKIITKAGKPLAEVDVANYGSQMAAVLYYLHRQNPPIVFRDVKPSNIMICGDKVKLIDFGIARLFTPAKKGDTMRIGSPGYAPPEQYSGQSDPRSDMYALGVTLHHALTYHDPTESQTPFLIPPARQLNPALSLEIVQIIERSTQLDPDKRYANMLDMRRDLQSVLRLHGIQTGASTPLQPMTMAGSSTPIQPAVSPSQPTTPQLATQGPILQPAQTAQNPMTPAGLPVSALTGPPPPTTPPPAKSTPSAGGMAGRLVSSLLKVAVVAGIGLGGWTLANQKQIKVPEPVQQFIQSMSSPVLPADPGQAALLMAQRGGPNESILTLCENSLKQQPSDAAVLLAYQNALLRQAKVADRQLDVLIPAGASAENLRRCVVVAQRVLSNRGLAYPVINLVEFDASSADGLQSSYLQLSSKSTTRAGDPAQRSLLVYTTKSANLKPSASAIPTFWAGRNLASSPTGIQTLNLADSPWSEWVTKSSQIEPDKLLWLSEKAPPTGSIKVSSTDALAKEAVKSLGKAKAIVADVSQFQAIQQLPIPIKLPTYLLSETSVQLPATIKGDSAWLALCASSEMSEYPVQGDAIRLSSQIFGDKSPMESSEAIDLFDALLWSCSGEQTRFYGMRLRRNESGKLIPTSPSFWAWTEGWRVKNTSGSGAQP
jgi:serine/threonine protein kinase